MLALVPPDTLRAVLLDAPAPGAAGRFLDAHELDTLRAVTDRLLPGPPDDPDPGALQARCAEAIDALLGAFTFDPPLIFAGGPWSNRDGGATDDMAHFVPLDDVAELGWRIRLEGSKGMPEREFAGPVVGLQEVYTEGLAALDRAAAQRRRGATFVTLAHADQEGLLRADAVQDFVTQALSDTVDAMYGPPEYGGNHGLVGWKATRWPGDAQPRGYTPQQVSTHDHDARAVPYSPAQIKALVNEILIGATLLD